jgi:hypothetical protein
MTAKKGKSAAAAHTSLRALVDEDARPKRQAQSTQRRDPISIALGLALRLALLASPPPLPPSLRPSFA